MGKLAGWTVNGLQMVGTVILVAISIPLLVALVVLMRPLAVVLIAVSLVIVPALALCSRRFRVWFGEFCDRPVPYVRHLGFRLTADTAMHPGHSWVRVLGQRVNIGVDDLVQTTLGPVDKVELPRVGTRCQQGEALFTLRRGDRVLQVRSPLTGTVEAVNTQLHDFPELINRTPFTDGWAVCVRAEQMEQEGRKLLRGNLAQDWFCREVDRLIGHLMPCHSVGFSLPDGGELVKDLHNQISDREWQSLARDFFDTPMVAPQPVAPSASV